MIVGKVIGSIVSTRKNDKLLGNKFMMVEPISTMGNPQKKIVAIDQIGAGIGELVLVALGSAARVCLDDKSAPVDAAIVGIVDADIGVPGYEDK